MAQYKNQHWLPAGYMKFFSLTGKTKGRDSRIYYTNNSECKAKKVKNLSCKDYHYSETKAEEAESSFHEMENEYPILIGKLLKGNDLTKIEYYSLILSMIDYHARNASYENLTGEENYEAFKIVSKEIMNDIFKDCNCQGDFQKMLDFFAENWVLQPLLSKKEELFSSDHPSLMFSRNDRLAFIILPITPHYALLAADKRKIEITGNEITDTDNGLLNSYQAYQCIEYVYSNIDLSSFLGDDKPLTKWLNKTRPKGFVKTDSWQTEFIGYPNNMPSEFSFLKIVE